MRYQDWKREVEHHQAALEPMRDGRYYRINDTFEVCVFINTSETGFSMRIISRSQGYADDLAQLTYDELLHVVALHRKFKEWVEDGGDDLPDPAKWNRLIRPPSE